MGKIFFKTGILLIAFLLNFDGSVLMLSARNSKNDSPFKLKQRIKNSSFEKGLRGWQVKGVRLIEDPLAAHSGTRCVFGEVRRRNTSTHIKFIAKLRHDRMYRLVVWARADNRSRLTIWRQVGEDRKVIANWQHVSGKWRRYRVNFSVEADGPATIKIVAPSSFWAPAGRMWVDDVALYELPNFEKTNISGKAGFNDFPVIAKLDKDQAWISWLSFRNGSDTLQVSRLKLTGELLNSEASWQIDESQDTNILNPDLVSNGKTSWLLYAAEHDKNWDIYAIMLDADKGPTEPIRITSHRDVDIHPSGVVKDDTLLIVWESNREASGRQIYLTALRNNIVGQPLCLSAGDFNNYQPAAALNKAGTLWVAWHSFRKNNYDIYSCTVTNGKPGRRRRLTQAPGIDRQAKLTASDNKVWMAWEYVSYTGYKLGKATSKKVQLAQIGDDRLLSPRAMKITSLWSIAESPEIIVDRHKRLWVSARVPRDRNSGWDVFLWNYNRDKWSPPKVLSTHKGMNRHSGIVVFDGLTAVCYQADDMPGRWKSVEESRNKGSSDIYCSLVEQAAVTKKAKLNLVNYEPPEVSFDAAALRTVRGEDRPGWNVDLREHKLRLLFGDLHEHSDISVCDRTRDETPEQSYQMMRDVARYDFGGLTDHGKCFNEYLWRYLAKVTRASADPGRFLSLLALEWTSNFEKSTKKYPYGYYGHRNLIFADPFFPKWYNAAVDITPAEQWEILRQDKADYVMIPHQLADTGNVPVDWGFNNQRSEPVAEIFQMRGSYECKGCPREARNSMPKKGHFLQDVWARGVIIGVIASPDHDGGSGKAAVYVTDFSSQAILEALRQRRTYGTTGAKILLDVRVNGLFMGEVGELPGSEPVRVDVRVDCPRPIRTVEIIRNNKLIFQTRSRGNKQIFTFIDNPPPGPAFYYVRVTQRNKAMAWSSPVWLGRIKK